jgi:hypothetical protein
MTDYERGYEQGKADATKKMHPEIRKCLEDYFGKCFEAYREEIEAYVQPPRPWVGLTDMGSAQDWRQSNTVGNACVLRLKPNSRKGRVPNREHGLTSKECLTCASPKHGDAKQIRQWKSLTEEEKSGKCRPCRLRKMRFYHICVDHQNVPDFARAIEQALKKCICGFDYGQFVLLP